MNNRDNPDQTQLSDRNQGGAFADGLTLARLAVTPLIMALVIWNWPDPQVAILATFLFIIGSVTDIFDDWFGGAARSAARHYGWLDDIADTVLSVGVLVSLSIVLSLNGLMHWAFFVPVAALILREILVGLVRGYELSRFGWPDNPWSNAKAGFSMLGVALLLSSPWLTLWLDRWRAGDDNAMAVYDTGSPLIWILGQGALWVAVIFSLISGYKILTTRQAKASLND